MSTMGFLKNSQAKGTNNSNLLVPMEFTHSCAIGQTGCGKTTSYIYPNLEERIKSNHAILLYDIKTKEHLAVKYFAAKHNRLNDVVEIGKSFGKSINILKYLSKKSTEAMFTKLFGGHRDDFWTRSTTNIAMSVLEVLKTLSVLKETAIFICGDSEILDRNMMFQLDVPNSFEYSLSNLQLIVQSKESLKQFVDNLDNYHDLFNALLDEMIEFFSDCTDQAIFVEYLYELNALEEKIDKTKTSLSTIIDDKKKNGSSVTADSMIVSINAPLSGIASLEYLNKEDEDFDLMETLKNKIIVVDTSSMPDSIIDIFNDTIFAELTKRSNRTNIKPVAVFIDEAQKVLSNDFELPTDILRECKVEVFLAFQNKELLIKKLGVNNCNALLKNLKTQYLFKNNEEHPVLDLASLDTYEYYLEGVNASKSLANYIRLDSTQLFEVEYQYQKSIGILKRFHTYITDEKYIFIYDSALIQENQIIVRTKDGNEFVTTFYDKKMYDYARLEVLERFDKFAEEYPPFEEDEDSYHYDDRFDKDIWHDDDEEETAFDPSDKKFIMPWEEDYEKETA